LFLKEVLEFSRNPW